MEHELSLHPTPKSTINFENNRRQNAENLTLIWLDIPVSEDKRITDRTMIIEQFQNIINNVHVFDDLDICIDCITDMKHEFIFLMITDSPTILLDNLEQVLDQFTNIRSIYIFRKDDTNNQRDESHFVKCRKVRGIFSSIKSIYIQLQKDTKRCEHNLINFDVTSENNLTNDQQEANFMYAQLLKECFLDIANNESDDIEDLIKYCREQYADNRHELARIDEFQRDYANHTPVWWYTRDGFLYKMLNKALRIQDVETLYIMRTFIKQLHDQLVYLHDIQLNNSASVTTFRQTILYRGQQLPSDEFMLLQNNQGGLLSINHFLSTTENRDLAIMFAGNNILADDGMVALLLEIHVTNDDVNTPPFAHIDQISFFGEGENEVLFSMSTVFRIESIIKQHSDSDFWLVKLTLTNANDPQLTQLTEYMREQMQDANPRDRLCQLLLNIGKNIEAENFLKRALQEIKTSDQQSQAALLHQLGFLYHEMGDLDKGIKEYKQSLTIKLSYLSENDPELSVTIANMSSIYRELDQLDLALTYIERALHIDQHQLNNETTLAARYHSKGMVLHDLNRIDEAVEQFNKALTIWKQHLLPTHPCIADTLGNLAAIYYRQEDYDKALHMYKQCLDLETKSLPAGHSSLAITHNNLAYTYYHKGYYQEALDHSLKAIELSRHALGDEHQNTHTFRKTLQTINQKLSSLSEQVD